MTFYALVSLESGTEQHIEGIMQYFNQTDIISADYCLWFGFTVIKLRNLLLRSRDGRGIFLLHPSNEIRGAFYWILRNEISIWRYQIDFSFSPETDSSPVIGVRVVWRAAKAFASENTSVKSFWSSRKSLRRLTTASVTRWSRLTTTRDASWSHAPTLMAGMTIPIDPLTVNATTTIRSRCRQPFPASHIHGATKATPAAAHRA